MISLKNYSVKDPTKGYLAKEVSLSLNKGEALGIVGESGSGKSMCALGMLGLISSNSLVFTGELQLFDEHIVIGSSDWKRQCQQFFGSDIGVIYQDPMTAMHPTIKCGEQLFEAIKSEQNKREKKDHCEHVIQKVGLDSSCLKKYPFQLSGGQQQRVMIAMAMINNPKLIIADEPNTALDKKNSDQIAELIGRLSNEIGSALLLISHDIDFIAQMSSRIAVMQKGEVVETAVTDQILNNPQHPYTKALLACKPDANKSDYYLAEIEDFMENKTIEKIPNVTASTERLAVKNINPVYGKGKDVFYPLKSALAFSIDEGKTLGLVGGSGSGKSSVAKCLVGWNESEGGLLKLEDKTYTLPIKSWKEIRTKVQYVFQDPYGSLNPSLNILNQLSSPFVNNNLGSYKDAKIKAESLIVEVGLKPEDLLKYPHAFSGGQRQRIVIARALMLDPSVLICDESVSALDLSVQAKILNLLKRLQISRGVSILFISHDKDVVDYFCDEVITLAST